ncbi:MAG: DNA double-strand break repair nuclease NurA [Candidatus Bathyarchaeota archaeon]|nr:DNA double-strand break repair nuclease NurA [Candidatus Bathyarchaeota archaeon]
MAGAEELPEWIKLPIDLQHGFFRLAEKEAEVLSNIVNSINSILKVLEVEVSPHLHSFPDQVKKSIVAAVDSSRSPRLSERLGMRYGVYATGAVYLRGAERLCEKFEPGAFRCRQALSRDSSKILFDLETLLCERRVALEALDHCDILFIDGSFYSFVYQALDLEKSGRFEGEERNLVNEIFDISERLRESGKVLGVIKRSRSRVLGGFMFKEYGNKEFVNLLDKHALSLIMPEKSFFEYRDIIGEKTVLLYTRIAYLVSMGQFGEDLQKLQKMAERGVYEPFEKLDLPKDGFNKMRRAQVRFSGEAPPCEIEYPSNIDIREVLSEEGLFSEDTNLPVALDLVDSLVNISSKFTEEFVSEIEGRVIEKMVRDGRSLKSIRTFFTFLNPQKPF